MKLARSAAFVAVLFGSVVVLAQRPPICDSQCGPDPGSGPYLSNVGARAKRHNARGHRNPQVARKPIVMSALLGQSEEVPGSQSFNWSTPIVTLPGRAGLDVNLSLYYNSRVWDINTADNNITFNIDRDFPSYGFRLDYGYLENDVTDGFWILTEGDGTKHQLSSVATNLWDSTEATYIELNSSNLTITYSDGLQVSYQAFPNLPSGSNPLYRPVQITDTNGNYISISYVASSDVVANQRVNTITDTLGRVITFNYNGSGQLTSITQGSFTYASFQWSTVNLNYSFTGLTVADTQASGTAISALTRCTLPNGTYYSFVYGDWGIVKEIDNFSGNGTLRSYQSYNFPTSGTALSDVPGYSQQTVSPDGTTQYPWNYSTTKSGDIVSAQSITDPSGTITTINLNTTDPCSGTAASVVVSSGSTTLRTITNTWTADASGNNCQVTKTVTTLSDSGQQAEADYVYDSNGNLTDQKDYDFAGALLRETSLTYYAPTSNHILNLVNTIVVKDGGGTNRSRTDFAYDNTTLTTISGATHNTGSATTRGNPTSITRYKNAQAGSGAIARAFNFDSLGNLIQAQLDCCVQKNWAFSSATQYAYPDSVTRGSGSTTLTTSTTYDFNSGQVLTSTDENGQTTQYSYDSARRPHQVTLPNNTILTTSYDDTSASASATSSNNVNSRVQVNTVDGLGRVIKTQVKNGASTVVSTVDTAYDGLGRTTSVSNPYAPADTEVYTTSQYDALGRPTQISPPSGGTYQASYSGNAVTSADPAGKQIRRISDALERLIEVDEPALSSTLTINGNEQFIAGSNPVAGSGTVTLSGSEQSVSSGGGWYCAWYDIGGGCADWEYDPPTTIYDSGTVTVTVNGFSKSVNYGQGDTTNTIASNLAAAFNGDSSSPVNASAASNVVTLTAKTTGSATNYSLSTSVTYDSGDFSSGSFSATRSGANLTGGSNGQNPIYDSGTVSATVNGFTKSVSYGQGSTGSGIASALASAFNSDSSSPVVATVAANVITFDATTFSGSSENLSASSTYDSSHFSAASFTTASGGNLTGSFNVPAITTYTYRATGELTGVNSGAQTRTYAYDDLGRLTSNTLPESGTTQFTYFDFGAVQTRTDARGVVTNYSYDGLNRLQQISYTLGSSGVADAGPVTFTYGTSSTSFNSGRLVTMTDPSGFESYTYQQMGWPTQVQKKINGTTYNVNYTYDGLGNPTQITYPSGRIVGQGYDAIGRMQTVSNAGSTALSITSYNAAGEVTAFSYGNSVSGSFAYNDHLQISSLSYSSGTNTLLSLTYNYGSQNNGQIQSVTDSRGAAYSTTYTYDPLRRLALAQTNDLTAANTWKLAWQYDRYGNRLSQTLQGGTMSVSQPQFSVDPTTNRITNSGFAYDANGNLTNDGVHQYAYDADNRMVSVDNGATANYSYDGNRLRVTKGSTAYIYSGMKVIAEYSAGTVQKEYIYGANGLLATITGSSTIYHHPDHLSNRIETDASGTVNRSYGTLPFGDTWYETGTADKWKFAHHERDSETGLDYALMRFSSSARLGRFMSPDLLGGRSANPQSLNRYAYSLNDPVNLADPTGLMTCVLAGQWQHNDYPDDGGEWKDVGDAFCIEWVSDVGDDDPNRGGPPDPIGGGGGGGNVGFNGKNASKLQKTIAKILKQLLSKDCLKFLEEHNISADDLAWTITTNNYWNGSASTISMYDSGAIEGLNTETKIMYAQTETMQQHFQDSEALKGITNKVGDVWLREPGILSSGGITQSTIEHESLHRLSGLGDVELANRMGGNFGADDHDAASAYISQALKDHKCAK